MVVENVEENRNPFDIEAIYYILSKLGKMDKLKLLKLVYLADKYHLIYYGRTITNDDYYAMKHGPIASNPYGCP